MFFFYVVKCFLWFVYKKSEDLFVKDFVVEVLLYKWKLFRKCLESVKFLKFFYVYMYLIVIYNIYYKLYCLC